MHVWVYGPTGAGKTAAALWVLRKFRDQHSVSGVYVNCWEQGSLYFVLSKILDELRILHTDVRDSSFKRERLVRHLRERRLIVVLDEIDKPVPVERNAILYNLATIERLTLICICNNRYLFHLAEDRVKSRLAPVLIEFPAYAPAELEGILSHRARTGMAEGSWKPSQLKALAVTASGDARLAIQALLRAAFLAAQEGAGRINGRHIRRAVTQATDQRKDLVLQDLTEDHRIMHRIVTEKKQVLSGVLFAEYRRRCEQVGRVPIAIRTFSNYVNALGNSGLIAVERARVPGKVRLLKVA
jgi:Cdc6-like AAA superfamily ATPase